MTDANERVRLIKYAVLQTTIAPSLICDLFIIIHFIRHWRKQIIKAPQNHVILCLLLVSFIQKITDAPFILYYLRWGVVIQQTYTFCVAWNWWDDSTLAVSLHLVTWCCIERHLFVFHNQMMKKKWCLILFHYIPLIICLLYTPVFYAIVEFFPTRCTNVWDYSLICGGACYSFDPFLGAYDWLCNYGFPTLIILLANIFLFCRIIWQKVKQQRPVQWRRQKRMIIQLVFISLLYLILLLPSVIVGVIEALLLPTFLVDIQFNYFLYILYFINQLLSFVIVGSLPELQKELRQWTHHMRRYLGGGGMRIHPSVRATAGHRNRDTAGSTD
jgi:hypothetical protein